MTVQLTLTVDFNGTYEDAKAHLESIAFYLAQKGFLDYADSLVTDYKFTISKEEKHALD